MKKTAKQELQLANAAGDDRRLWPHGIADPHYWYSMLDGFILLRITRRNFLTYQDEHSIPGNDPSAAHRENLGQIFVSDPYEFRNFQKYLNDDIMTITGNWQEPNTNRNNQWAHMPHLLIIPILTANHWRSVRIKIDYTNKNALILWDDPCGSNHFPEFLRNAFRQPIRSAILQFFKKELNKKHIKLKDIDIQESAKDLVQQDIKNNAWDCGPITFSNIRDYIQAFIQKIDVLYTVKADGTLGCLADLYELRKLDAFHYREEIGAALSPQIQNLVNNATSRNSERKNTYQKMPDVNKLNNLSSYWIDIFHSHIVSARLEKNQDPNAKYTKKEIKKALEYIQVCEQSEADLEKSNLIFDKVLPDPFDWHVKKYKEGILSSIDKLDDTQLKALIELIEEGVQVLYEQKAFKRLNKVVRSQLHAILTDHIRDGYISKIAYDEYLEQQHDEEIEKKARLYEARCQVLQAMEDDPDNADYIREDNLSLLSDDEPENSSSIDDDREKSSEGNNESHDDIWASNDDVEPSHEAESSDEDAFDEWRIERIRQIDSSADEVSKVDLQKLVNFCRGEGLDWLLHEIVEYHQECSEYVSSLLIAQTKIAVDPDIIRCVIDSTTMDRVYTDSKVKTKNFIAKSVVNTLRKLKRQDEQPSKTIENVNVFLTTRKHIIETVNKNFARVSKLINMGKFHKFKNRFNDAYYRSDWIEVQKLWAVFSKFQRLIQSTDENPQSISNPSFEKSGQDYSLKKKPTSFEELLNETWKVYNDRANAHYYRVYLEENLRTLSYGSRTYDKIAKIDLTKILGELESAGREIKDYIIAANPKDTTNILVPVFCFVVSTEPHVKGGKHRRIFVVVSFNKQGMPYLVSKNKEDGVFTGKKDSKKYFKDQAISHYTKGLKIIGGGTTLNPNIQNLTGQSLNHSERVTIEALGQNANIDQLIIQLQKELETMLGHALTKGEYRYKVYTLSLLAFSTNSVCRYCTPSLISLANSYDVGFLKLLTDKLNNSQGYFKTRGFDQIIRKQDATRFRMATFISSDHNYTEQADDLAEKVTRKVTQYHRNPDGRIRLPKHTLDLKTASLDKDGKPYPRQRGIFEFVAANFEHRSVENQSPVQNNTPRFFHPGHVFMSGKKQNVRATALAKIEALGVKKKGQKTQSDLEWLRDLQEDKETADKKM